MKKKRSFLSQNSIKKYPSKVIDGKKVYFMSNTNLPPLKAVKKIYRKIPDDKKVPVVFETKTQYLREYIKNQEHLKNIDFPKSQEQQYINQELPKMKYITSRFTTYHNKYIEPRVVMFTDRRLTPQQLRENILHEYGHEKFEKEKLKKKWHFSPKTSPTMYGKTDKEEDFAESYALYKDNQSKQLDDGRLQAMRDLNSRNMAIRWGRRPNKMSEEDWDKYKATMDDITYNKPANIQLTNEEPRFNQITKMNTILSNDRELKKLDRINPFFRGEEWHKRQNENVFTALRGQGYTDETIGQFWEMKNRVLQNLANEVMKSPEYKKVFGKEDKESENRARWKIIQTPEHPTIPDRWTGVQRPVVQADVYPDRFNEALDRIVPISSGLFLEKRIKDDTKRVNAKVSSRHEMYKARVKDVELDNKERQEYIDKRIKGMKERELLYNTPGKYDSDIKELKKNMPMLKAKKIPGVIRGVEDLRNLLLVKKQTLGIEPFNGEMFKMDNVGRIVKERGNTLQQTFGSDTQSQDKLSTKDLNILADILNKHDEYNRYSRLMMKAYKQGELDRQERFLDKQIGLGKKILRDKSIPENYIDDYFNWYDTRTRELSDLQNIEHDLLRNPDTTRYFAELSNIRKQGNKEKENELYDKFISHMINILSQHGYKDETSQAKIMAKLLSMRNMEELERTQKAIKSIFLPEPNINMMATEAMKDKEFVDNYNKWDNAAKNRNEEEAKIITPVLINKYKTLLKNAGTKDEVVEKMNLEKAFNQSFKFRGMEKILKDNKLEEFLEKKSKLINTGELDPRVAMEQTREFTNNVLQSKGYSEEDVEEFTQHAIESGKKLHDFKGDEESKDNILVDNTEQQQNSVYTIKTLPNNQFAVFDTSINQIISPFMNSYTDAVTFINTHPPHRPWNEGEPLF